MRIRVISLFLAIAMVILLIPTAVQADAASSNKEEAILQQIRQTYKAAQRNSGIYSFNGLCGTMVSWQTYLLGMDESMYAYDGNRAFDTYRWKDHSGDYRVESFPASRYSLCSALNAITQNGTVDAYNILVGFQWTHTSAGSKYGHAVFVHAILDGTVYFMESYNATVDGKYYREGQPIACSIEAFCKYYSSWTALDGVIHFGVKNYADLCESFPANMSAMPVEEVPVYAEPTEMADLDSAEHVAYLPAGKTVTVTRMHLTPGGSYWYELRWNGEYRYVPAEALVAVDLDVNDIVMEGLAIPGVIRKSSGAVLQGVISSRSGALEWVEVLVYAAGEEEPVLTAEAEVAGNTVYLSDKQIDRALSFRALPVGTYDIVIRARMKNNLLENGLIKGRTRWEELWTARVQIVSDWNRYVTVLFDGNGGVAELDQTALANGASLQELPAAIWEGHVFMGWSLRPDGSQMVDADTAIWNDTTLYAVWQRETSGAEEGAWYTVNGLLFYQDKDGNAPSGWTLVEGEYHYFNEAGVAMSGWQEIGGNCYYLNEDGSKVWGWQTIDDERYYFRFDGMQRGTWLVQGKNLYYLDETGRMVTGCLPVGGQECHFGTDGKLCLTKVDTGTNKQYVVYDRQAAREHLPEDAMALLS